MGFNTRYGERTLFLLDLVTVLSVNVGGLDLSLQSTGCQLIHRVCYVSLELAIDDSCETGRSLVFRVHDPDWQRSGTKRRTEVFEDDAVL